LSLDIAENKGYIFSMELFHCPHLNANVELSDEREQHIAQEHPDLLPEFRSLLSEVLQLPDRVRISSRYANARLFSRYFSNVREGKHIVVVVVIEPSTNRHWIVTAYLSRQLSEGYRNA
jgi:hypothetical protein